VLNDCCVTDFSLTLKVTASTNQSKALALGGTPLGSLCGDHTLHAVQGCKAGRGDLLLGASIEPF